MRNSIVLTNSYQIAFNYEGLKSGILKRKEVNFGIEEVSNWFNDEIKDYHELLALSVLDKQQEFFQAMLLYDNIIIPTEFPDIDYSIIDDLGITIRTSFEKYSAYNPMIEDSLVESANYLRGAIIPLIERLYGNKFRKIDSSVDINVFLNSLYDAALGIGQLSSIETKLLNSYLEKEYARSMGMGLEFAKKQNQFLLESFFDEIVLFYKNLCWQLDLSSLNDAYLLDSDYDLTKLGMNSNNPNQQAKAYGILKCAYGSLIHSLPGFSDLREVFEVKRTKKQEIKDLKQEMAHLESILISEDPTTEEKALRRAIQDIEKARDALNKKMPVVKNIGQFTTLMGVPVGLAESYTNYLDGINLGLGVAIVGASMCITEKKLEKRCNWIEIIR